MAGLCSSAHTLHPLFCCDRLRGVTRLKGGVTIRRLIWSAALFACAGIYVSAAAARATFILTDGERKSGIVVFHGGQNENLINGHLNLGVDNGKDMTFPIEQVAVIDFVGGQPPNTELSQLGTRHMLVTRDGGAQPGSFVNMIGGDRSRGTTSAVSGSSSRFPMSAVSTSTRKALALHSITPRQPRLPALPLSRRPRGAPQRLRPHARSRFTSTPPSRGPIPGSA